MRYFFLMVCLLGGPRLIAQIDVRQYASDDLFAVKPVVASDRNEEDNSGYNSWAERKLETAWTNLSNGNTDEALNDLDELIDYNDSYPVFHYLKGMVYMELEDYDQARKKFNDALSASPLFLDAKYQLGMISLELGDVREAKAYFKDLTEIKDYAALGYHGLGYEALQRNNAYGAMQDFKRSIDADPEFTDSYGTLAIIYIFTGAGRKGEKLLEEGIAANPEWEEGIAMKAILSLLLREDLDAFEADLNKLISMSPGNYHYLFLKAAVMIEKEEWHAAIEQYQKAYDLDTAQAGDFKFTSKISREEKSREAIDYYFDHYEMAQATRAYMEQGICEMIRSNNSDAIRLIKEANENEATAAGYTLLGVLGEKEMLHNVISIYSSAIELDTMNSFAISRRAELFVEQKNYEAAFLDYDRLVNLFPSEKDPWKKRGIMLSQINYPVEAYKDFSRAISLDTTDMELFFNRATLAYQMKYYEESKSDLHFLLRHTPEDGEAWYMLHSIDLYNGDTLQALSRLDSASKYLRLRVDVHKQLLNMATDLGNTSVRETAHNRLIRSRRYAYEYLLWRGIFYYEEARYQEALRDVEEYLSHVKKSGNGLYYLSKIYAALGEDKKSERSLKKAQKLGFDKE